MSTPPDMFVYRVLQPFNDGDLVLNIGDEGWAVEKEGGYSVITYNTRKPGFVPSQYIEIGKKVTGLTFRGLDPVIIQPPITNIAATSTVLSQTLDLLFKYQKMNELLLVNIGCAGSDINLLAQEPNVKDAMIRAIPIQLKSAIQDGDFTFESLWLQPEVSKNDHRAGIYLILYRDIDGKDGTYCGKSVNIGRRAEEHERCLDTDNPAQHYQLGRRARAHKIILFAHYQHSEVNLEVFLRLTEHVAVCLFLSWNSKLLRVPDSLDELRASIPGILAAKTLYSLASKAFKETGWPVDKFIGLNWSSPLSEHFHEMSAYGGYTIWNVQSTPTMRVFSRSPRIAQLESLGREHEIQMMGRSPGNPGGVRLHLPFATGIKAGMAVHVVCEVKTDGTDHPYPIAGYLALVVSATGPLFGRIRAVWQAEDGVWKTTWFQCNRFDDTKAPMPDGSECAIEPWQRTTLILDALMRVQYTTTLPAWKSVPKPIIVKEISYDHWNQEVTIQDARQIFLEAPKPVSFDNNELALRHRYPGIIIGTLPPKLLGKRLACDLCYIRHYIHGTTKSSDPCKQYHGTLSCARCTVYRRPCTWTPTHTLEEMIKNGQWEGLSITRLYGRVDNLGAPHLGHASIVEDKESEEL